MTWQVHWCMPQAGIDPPRQSHETYEASAPLPSHHGWILHCTNYTDKMINFFCELIRETNSVI